MIFHIIWTTDTSGNSRPALVCSDICKMDDISMPFASLVAYMLSTSLTGRPVDALDEALVGHMDAFPIVESGPFAGSTILTAMDYKPCTGTVSQLICRPLSDPGLQKMIQLKFEESGPWLQATRLDGQFNFATTIAFGSRLNGPFARTYRSHDSAYIIKVSDPFVLDLEWRTYTRVARYTARPLGLYLINHARSLHAILLSYEGQPKSFACYSVPDRCVSFLFTQNFPNAHSLLPLVNIYSRA